MEREYRYLDIDELRSMPLEPVTDSCEEVLREALLDIVQLASDSGMLGEEIDRVIANLMDWRARTGVVRFRVLEPIDGQDPGPSP